MEGMDQMGSMFSGMSFALPMQEIVKKLMEKMGDKKPIQAGFLSILLISVVTRGSREIGMLADKLQLWISELLRRFVRMGARRTIKYSSGGPSGDAEASTEKNNILQKAIRFYINKNIASLEFKEAELYLESASSSDNEAAASQRMLMMMLDGRRGGGGGGTNGTLDEILQYAVKRAPVKTQWAIIDKPRQIEYMCTEEDISFEGSSRPGAGASDARPTEHGLTTYVQLRCSGFDAESKIDDYVNEALDYYKELKKSQVDHRRYFFVPQSNNDGLKRSGGGGGRYGPPPGNETFMFKKYELSDSKDFESLFFEEKDELLHYLDTFKNKTGKFAIKGYPHKLGLLLYGPPGTGKTSLIKSIATYFQRHIVDVPLAKIRTNQELLDLMNDLTFEGDDEPQKMKFEDLVFVMEDVDAASDVVYKRSEAKNQTTEPEECDQHETEVMVHTVSGQAGLGKMSTALETISETASEHEGGDVEGADEPKGEKKDKKQKKEEMKQKGNTAEGDKEGKQSDKKLDGNEEDKNEDKNGDDKSSDKGEVGEDHKLDKQDINNIMLEFEKLKVQVMHGRGAFGDEDGKGSSMDKNDKLNLSGLLNTLDGVVDAPGRILIMTTNHHKKLDEALIRPGRINRCIELGYLKGQPLCDFISFLMAAGATLTERQRQRCVNIAEPANKITPAVVESACADLDDIDSLLDKLEQHGKTRVKIEIKRQLSGTSMGSSSITEGRVKPKLLRALTMPAPSGHAQ